MGEKTLLGLVLVCSAACASGGETPEPDVLQFEATKGVEDICSILMSSESSAALPEIKPEHESIRVLAFGDFGDGGDDQKTVAAAMVRYDKDHPFDFGLTLGDNFYGRGLNDPHHARWQTDWEALYGPLGVRIYATMGNHDYYDPNSPLAEVQRTKLSKSWCLPTPYYAFMAGPVQFFAIDTDPIYRGADSVKSQLAWLKDALAASQASWKVVYGHHPIYTTGYHQKDPPTVRNQILPVLKDRADVYIAGHDHDMQFLKPAEDVQLFIAGAGGHDLRALGPDKEKRLLWGVGMTGGFAVLEAAADSLTVSFIDTKQTALCVVKLVKGKPAEVLQGCK